MFYAAVLGWEYAPGQDPGRRQVTGTTPVQGLWGGVSHGTLFCSYVVDDAAAAVAWVRAAGGQAREPVHQPYGLSADCVDDQGIRFAVHEPPGTGGGPRPEAARDGDLAYVTMEVPDSAKTREFYASVLGWHFVPGRVADGWQVENVRPMTGISGGHAEATGIPLWRVIADSCTSVSQIAADYESVITTLGVTRLDMDVEAKSLNNTAGVDRRNQAIAMTEAWAASQGIPLQIQYTLPVEQYGLDANGEAVLQSAVINSAAVTSVNIMVFDYYIAGEGTVSMGQAAVNAATNTHTQLATIYPALTSAQIWAMEAMTMLPGIDDYPKKTEVTYLPDAQTMLSFAQSNGMNFLSIWAIQRDNGGCPGTRDSNTCSGIVQNTWDFSHLLEPFTS